MLEEVIIEKKAAKNLKAKVSKEFTRLLIVTLAFAVSFFLEIRWYLGLDTNSNSNSNFETTAITKISTKRLPTLDELTSIPASYHCPEGLKVFENIVLPRHVTHSNRKIPKVIHITAKTRCVSNRTRDHILKWSYRNHSLYFHDDAAVYKLLDYASNDRFGNEVVQNISKMFTCMTNGATLSDMWRYVVLYHYGGIYTDLDNAPGPKYTAEIIQPDTDSFFFVEGIGTMSQFYLSSSRHHPLLLQIMAVARSALYIKGNNVMVNNPAQKTGPHAVKCGMILFQRAINISTKGYLPEGLYHGGLGETESELPWYNNYNDIDNKEYPTASELMNRTVTILGDKRAAKRRIYINRRGMGNKGEEWKKMNMSHYHGLHQLFPSTNQISCQQHATRMAALTTKNTSFYYNKSGIADLIARYQYRISDKHYFDPKTNETLIPW